MAEQEFKQTDRQLLHKQQKYILHVSETTTKKPSVIEWSNKFHCTQIKPNHFPHACQHECRHSQVKNVRQMASQLASPPH